jgi:chromosomal replication initiation ATPase DnaA
VPNRSREEVTGGRLVRQLALPFAHAPGYGAADFLAAGSNAAALAWLARADAWPQRRLALFGPEGCGKTHLLHIWADRSAARVVNGPMLGAWPFPGAEPLDRPLAVDDADAAAEQPLLHLLNAAGEAGLPVLLAGRAPPARWNSSLADLASRLRAITAVGIGPAEDALLRSLLARLLAERQLAVAEPLQDWLRLLLPRAQGALREAVARLDRATLAAGGRVTRALVLQVAAGFDGEAGGKLLADEIVGHGDVVTSPESPCLL